MTNVRIFGNEEGEVCRLFLIRCAIFYYSHLCIQKVEKDYLNVVAKDVSNASLYCLASSSFSKSACSSST